jgi:hypothetical protein
LEKIVTDENYGKLEAIRKQVGNDRVFLDALNHLEKLVLELGDLVREANSWGEENGYPEVSDYPCYMRIREIGEEFFRLAGFGGMQKALSSTQKRLNDFPPTQYSYAIIEYGWSGIGGWQS